MNTVFSVDDLTDSFWPPLAPAPEKNGMTRSQSEWAFQRLLEEISLSAGRVPFLHLPRRKTQSAGHLRSFNPSRPYRDKKKLHLTSLMSSRYRSHKMTAVLNPRILLRSILKHYQEILKTKLDLACAAVALRVATVKPEDSSASSGIQKQPPPLGSQIQVVAQMPPDVSSVSTAPSLGTQNKPDVHVRQGTSGSSRYDSDDEDLDGDTENTDPADVKRAKRMLSNRESARRSRKRKQEQMNELDTQVGQLRAEHSTLLMRLTDMNQKYDAATVDNRILKADIETLRTKVKMAEETVERVKGLNPLLLARSNGIPSGSTPTVSEI